MPQPISPQVQAQGGQQYGPEYAEELFKQRFTQMAYQVLFSKFSELAPYIVTFKLLDTDPDEGSGAGVVILNYRDKTVYIPVVMVDSRLKPLEMFFYKELNIFLPLSMQWLEEVSKMSLDEMGSSAKLPQEVPQDVNIRDLVMPPMTTSGRVGFASANDLDAKVMFKEAENHRVVIHPQFLNVLRTAPLPVLDGVKLAFARNPELLQKFAKNYGINTLTSAMSEGYTNAKAMTKTAAPRKGEVRVVPKTASSKTFGEVFGTNAGNAFADALKLGFAVSDTRSGFSKVAVKVEGPVFLDSPGMQSGWYRLYFVDGHPGIYYVIPYPKGGGSFSNHRMTVHHGLENDHRQPIEYIVISKDGKEVWCCDDIMGQRVHEEESDSKIGKILKDAKGDTPAVRSYGFFLNVSPRGISATKPFRIEAISTDGDITRISADCLTTYVIDGDPSRKNFNAAMDGQMTFVPNTAKFVEIFKATEDADKRWRELRDYERQQKSSVIRDPKVVLRWMNHILQKANARPTNVKSAGLDQWWVEKSDQALYVAPALEKVASIYGISVADAAGILIDAQKYGRSQSYILDCDSGRQIKQAFEKIAQMPQEGPMQYQSQPGQTQGLPQMGDPNVMQPEMSAQIPMGQGAPPPDPMAAMQQQQQQQPQQGPAPLSPTDLAIGEAVQGLQQQNQMMQQQNQSQMQQLQQTIQMQTQQNEQLIGVLQGIQQRAGQLSQATGGQIPEGALNSPMVSAQMLAPTPPPQPEPPPTPMMSQEGLSPENVASQINPSMVNDVESFQDSGMFDTAAIAMLAAAPVLQDIISTYVPNLEKAVDNLGRILLTLWMKESDTKKAIGDENYIELEDKLRTVFKNLGDVVLALSHNAMSVQSDADKAQMQMQAHRG